MLKESLVLSEYGQKFLIGREIAVVRTPYLYSYAVYPFSAVLFVYAVTRVLNHKLRLLERPPILRAVMYALVGLFGFGTWLFVQDYSALYYEAKSDKDMCSLGEEYIKGGIEAYSKLIERNIALRSLMGAKGRELYTAAGNEIYFWRQKHLPVVHRKLYLENQLKDIQKKPNL